MTTTGEDGVYFSWAAERAWVPDTDIGGQADLVVEDGATTAGLWRSGPGPASPADPVQIPARETVYVITGRVRVSIDDGDAFDLGSGDMISIPAQAMVGWDPSDDCEVFWVYS